MPEKILFIDTETGGLDPNFHSLLSVAFAVWENYEIKDAIEVMINDGILNVSEKALEINGINIEQHSIIAKKPSDAILDMEIFFKNHFDENEKIILCGHNILFDINFFKTFWNKHKGNYNNRFSHRYVDTASILFFLTVAGKLPNESNSSQNAFNHFKIQVNNRHSALGDVLATSELFNKLLYLISSQEILKKQKSD